MMVEFFKGSTRKTDKTHEAVKGRVKKTVPFFFTFANAIFGFLSIINTLEGNFVEAALCILIAALMDASDGRLARYLDTVGPLGQELDSLCDAVSFCLAPTVLLYSWYTANFGNVGIFMIALALYLCSGLFRLARFNLLPQEDRTVFIGLPTTIAAFFCAASVLYYPDLTQQAIRFVISEYMIVIVVGLIAFLMVSRVHFPAFKGSVLGGVTRRALLIRLVSLVVFLVWCASLHVPLLLGLVTLYIAMGIIMTSFSAIKRFFNEFF